MTTLMTLPIIIITSNVGIITGNTSNYYRYGNRQNYHTGNANLSLSHITGMVILQIIVPVMPLWHFVSLPVQ